MTEDGSTRSCGGHIRKAILAAFEEAGGVDYLRRVAKEDQDLLHPPGQDNADRGRRR